LSQTASAVKEIKLHRVLKDWGEGTTDAQDQEGAGGPITSASATWIHTVYDTGFWQNSGGDFAAVISATKAVGAIGFYTWEHTAQMAADIQFWLEKTDSNFSWILIGDESTISTAKRFDSSESLEEANRPCSYNQIYQSSNRCGVRGKTGRFCACPELSQSFQSDDNHPLFAGI
jgi:hypothetical protein